jgi:hypothetical protein
MIRNYACTALNFAPASAPRHAGSAPTPCQEALGRDNIQGEKDMKRLKLTGLLLAFGLVAGATAQENFRQWTGHQRLWLNTQSNGAAVNGNVLNFPVLVRLTTAQTAIFAQAKAGGADIRFSKTDTVTRLRHQIERWDTAAKAAEIWVLVDTVKGANGSQSILMHWGKADAADSSSGPGVFQTANGFQAVYHLNQDAASPALDATTNSLNATPTSVRRKPSTAPHRGTKCRIRRPVPWTFPHRALTPCRPG